MIQEPDTTAAAGATTGETSAAGRFGEYLIERRLGVGGMGAVYLARREADGKAVALKILNPVAGANAETVKRFNREARVLLALEHPGIVKADDLGAVNGQHFIAMEYVPGEDLGKIIMREGRVDARRALGIMRQVADALNYGWKHRLVHRDLKPENFLIRPDGICKLADLGLAVLANREDLRVTAPGTVMGTPECMSPEQARGERDVDTRSDVYSLGCAIYNAICGHPVFEGETAVATLKKHITDEPCKPSLIVEDLMPGVEDILLKCIRKKPEERYQTCGELVEAIDELLGSSANVAEPEAPEKSAGPDADDALALLTAQARTVAPATSNARPAPVRERPGSAPRPSTGQGSQGQRKTRTTIHMAGSRRGKLPVVPLAIAAFGAFLALFAAVMYLYLTSS